MVYWVIYDISKNNIRSKVSNLCKDYGLKRIQKSAFSGNLTRNKAEMLSLEIKKIMKSKNDKVLIFPSSEEEFSKRIAFGPANEFLIKNRDVIFI